MLIAHAAAPAHSYVSPSRREEEFAAGLRASKEAAAAQAATLKQQYGADGAAAMQQFLAMRHPDRRPLRIKSTREDLVAVLQLPMATLAEP